MQMNGATALIKALEDLGVKRVFGIPGVQNIEIYDALLASGIEHVLVRHEQAAVHMADGYSRASGSVGVVFATSGPGATNTVTGIATAYMDSMPVVVITGQVSTTAIGTDAFQEADITTITLPITKHSYLLKDVEALVPSVFEAFYLATSGRPGPVLIDVPGNVASAKTVYLPPTTAPALPSYKPTIKGNARQIKAAAELITRCERPVFLAGGGVVSSSGASEELVSLAERCAIPMVTTLLAKGVIAYDNPLFVGQPGVYGNPAANELLQEADVLIAVGTRFSERVTADAAGFAPHAKVIHIDIDPAEIGKNIRVDIPIVGDAATVLAALAERLTAYETAHGDGSRESSEMTHENRPRELLQISWDRVLPDSLEPEQQDDRLSPFISNVTHTVFSVLSDLLRDRERSQDVIVTTDVGQHQIWASHLLQTDKPRHFITSGGLGTMGFGLPAALGVQIACPESLVLCISGDGSFQMNLQEMATAVAQNLPVKVAIINNHSHGLVRQYQELFLEQRCSYTLIDAVPDYVKLAEAYGWQGRVLKLDSNDSSENYSGATITANTNNRATVSTNNSTTISTIKDAFTWLLETEGPSLLDIVVPTTDLFAPLVKPGGTLTEVIWDV